MQVPTTNFLQEEKQELEISAKQKRKRKMLLLFSALLLLGGCVFAVSRPEEAPDDPNAYNPLTLEPKEPEGLFGKLKDFVFHNNAMLEGEKDDRINILLLGMGGPGHDGPFLTDTIMIASVKPSTGQIALISIPRDLAVDIPGQGVYKINHANNFGEQKRSGWGGAFTTEVIENTFDIDIHYYTRIDFNAFEKIIDEVGGLNINVERSFADEMYPAPDDEYKTVSFTKGTTHMDGDKALIYARSRHGSNGEGSDFARARRQQKVLLALKEKLLSFETLANPIRINNIIKTLEAHISTNADFSDIISLLKLTKDLDTGNITTLVFDDSPTGLLKSGYTDYGAFILEPKSGDFKNMQIAIEHIFEYEGGVEIDDTPEQDAVPLPYASIEVQNGTWHVGLASRMRKRLQNFDFVVTSIGNTVDRPQAVSGIFDVSGEASEDVMVALQKELQLPIKESAPSSTIIASSTDILIILGENFDE